MIYKPAKRAGVYPCIRPLKEVMQAFEQICTPLDSKVELNERTYYILSTIRDTALPHLLANEVDLSKIHMSENI